VREWLTELRREALPELRRMLTRLVMQVVFWGLLAIMLGALGYAVYLHVRIGDADIRYERPGPKLKAMPAEPPRDPWEGKVQKVK
jgi:hypothetical protein